MALIRLIRCALHPDATFDRAGGGTWASLPELQPAELQPGPEPQSELQPEPQPELQLVGRDGNVLWVDFVMRKPMGRPAPSRRQDISMAQSSVPIESFPHDWAEDAKCRGMNVNIFFGRSHEEIYAAKAICRLCPVRKSCLEEAIRNPSRKGVWGGTSERERKSLRH